MAWQAIASQAIESGAAQTSDYISLGVNTIASRRRAERAQAFSERMANTAHQREVRDFIAAGINPVLTAGGSGASSPEGVMYDVSMPDPSRNIRGFNQSVASRRLMDAQATRAEAEADYARNNAATPLYQQQLLTAEKDLRLRDAGLSTARQINETLIQDRNRTISQIAKDIGVGISSVKKIMEALGEWAGDRVGSGNGFLPAPHKLIKINPKSQYDSGRTPTN